MGRYNKVMSKGLDLRGQAIINAKIVNSSVQGLPTVLAVTDITALTASQLDKLQAGDVVVKQTGNKRHSYVVAYKDNVKGEASLVYCDHETIEEVYYEKGDAGWAYVTTDSVTPGGN